MKKNIYIIYEVEYRDLLPRIKLAENLTKRGFRVFILTLQRLKALNFILPKGIVILQKLSPVKNYINIKFVNKHKCCLIHEEPLRLFENYIDPDMVYDKELLKKMEFVSCVSKKYKDIIDKFTNFKAKTIVHGSIKIALSNQDKIDPFVKKNIQELKKKYSNIIFFPSNFPFITYKLQNNDKNDFRSSYLMWRNFKGYKKFIKVEKQLNIHNKRVLIKYIDTIKKIANKFKNNTIVVRPHPAEHPLFWKNKFDQKNIKVVYDYDVKTWICLSKVIILHWCTSAIEAYNLNKKPICYLPFYNKKLDHKFYYKTYQSAFKEKRLFSLIGMHLKKQPKIKKQILNNYFFQSKEDIFIKISKDIEKINITRTNIILEMIYLKFYKIYSILTKLINRRDKIRSNELKWPNKVFKHYAESKKNSRNRNSLIYKIICDEVYLIE